MKNIGLISALHFSASFGYGSLRYEPTHSKFRYLLVVSQSGSLRHDPCFVLLPKTDQLLLRISLSGRVRLAHHLTERILQLQSQNRYTNQKYLPDFFCALECAFEWLVGPYEKYRSDFSFALQCFFWVWLASLSSRLTVNSDTCSSSLSQARYAMTRVLFYYQRQINCFSEYLSVVGCA